MDKETLESKALQKIRKARSQLILDHPFWATLILSLELRATEEVPVMGTDMRYLYFNPEAVQKLSDSDATFIVAHEGGHVMLQHPLRCAHRHPEKWNAAGDLVINALLIDSGLKMPEGEMAGLYDPKYKGWMTDEVYKDLPEVKVEKGSGSGSEGNKKQRSGSGSGSDKSNKNNNSGNVACCNGLKPANNEGKQLSAAEARRMANDAKLLVKAAIKNAKMQGKLPAGVKRFVEAITESKTPWVDYLRRFMEEVVKDDYSWVQPNRRYAYTGVYLPNLHNKQTGTIGVYVDCSGSISQKQLSQFASELTAILEQVRPRKVIVVYWDAAVHGVEEFTLDDFPIRLQAKGGGGTDPRPAFDYMKKQDEQPLCAVVLTDMYLSDFPDPPPAYQVMWAVLGNTNPIDPPFGEVILIEE